MNDHQWALCDILLDIAAGYHNKIVHRASDNYDHADHQDIRQLARQVSHLVVKEFAEPES
jgi:hypothetical protein